MNPAPDRLDLEFPASIERQFPDVFDAAQSATNAVLASLDGVDFTPLAHHSRGLLGYEWSAYHRCNVVRAVRVGRLVRQSGSAVRVLDFGSYFGNFALMARNLGADVDAVDSYGAYAPAMDRVQQVMRERGIRVFDFAETGLDLAKLPGASYDVILCLGVIEHIPHSPRAALDALNRVLRPGGRLIVDTPNLSYLYKREAFARGDSVFPPIADQYYTPPPFEGHHREYTMPEVRWMLEQLGHEQIAVDTFDFSAYALGVLEGDAVVKHLRMQDDPSLRELILAHSTKPRG